MRATFRRLLDLLDGRPTGARGQSLVELTLTLPVLLVMLMGLTEIGWYANNYLTLLDVVREKPFEKSFCCLKSSESPNHEMHHHGVNHGIGGVDPILIIFAQAAIVT
mgnify:CR=1 FL=1